MQKTSGSVSPKIRSRATSAIRRNDYKEAELLFNKILSIDPTDYQARSNLALLYFETGKIDQLHQVAQKLVEDFPNDAGVLNKFAVSQLRRNQTKEAYETLKKAAALDESRFETFLNLSSIAGEVGDLRGGLEYSLKAISLDPSSPSAHINLGSALMTAGKPDEAKYSFETALELDPENYFAQTNLAVLATRGGNHERAVLEYEKCLAKGHPDPVEIKKLNFFMGLSYLNLGALERGWKHYKEGFVPGATNARNPVRSFKKPYWDFDLSKKVRLLVWREQGLGDELFFFSALNDLRKHSGLIDVVVESDHRLVGLLRRSFPEFNIRPQAYWDDAEFTAVFDDYDFHIPVADLFGFFRKNLESFKNSGPYLKVDEEASSLFDRRLGPRDGKIRLGICWRSGALSALRNFSYTTLIDWIDILKLNNVQIINLQYGDTENERLKTSRELGIFINHWPDLDLKDDLDNTAALCSQLDLVLSVGTASAQLACAVGTPTIILSTQPGWTSFGTAQYPVYPNSRLICPANPSQPVSTILPAIAKSLASCIIPSTSRENLLSILDHHLRNLINESS